MSDRDSNVELDSLFGSPPPSPSRGRSPSLLSTSLPTRSAHENVGTIALPGSHNISELPVNLLASSQNPYPQSQPYPEQYSWYQEPYTAVQVQSTPPQPRAPSRTRGVKQKKPKSQPRAPSTKRVPVQPKALFSTIPRPIPPISLPDPEDPPPANFLRNQQALLGQAGLVGRVNPANLSTRIRRGTSVENPIVVEEEKLQLNQSMAWKSQSPSFQSELKLPTPSSEEIVSALVKQKNIFPVLKSLLSLLGVEAADRSPMPPLPPPPPPQTGVDKWGQPKKRKLNRVPAGAGDWDVPFPFPQAEGPSNYLATWEKERGKRLTSQLVLLVKDAVHKAATRTYAQKRKKEWMQPEENSRYYRAEVSNYGIDRTNAAHIPAPHDSQNSPPPSHDSDSQSTPFDQLIASLLAAQSSGTGMPPYTDTNMPTHTPVTHGFSPDDFQMDLDSLLSDFKVDPNQNDISAWSMPDFTTTLSASPTLPSPTHLSMPFESNKENAAPATSYLPQSDFVHDFDFAIDPALFEPATPVPEAAPVLDPILLPLTSYIPPEASQPEWTPLLEDEIVNTTVPVATPSSSLHSPSPLPAPVPPPPVAAPLMSVSPEFEGTTTNDGADHTASDTGENIINTPASSRSSPSCSNSIVSKNTRVIRKAPVPLATRQENLRRAKARREQLAAEIARAKVELWETTIEQGVLVHLTKDS